MIKRLLVEGWGDYELLDAGNGNKLERFGDWVLIRPDALAYFAPLWDEKKWRAMADLRFHETANARGSWEVLKKPLPAAGWGIAYQDLRLHLKETPFKHIGVFPEQRANWDFVLRHDLRGKRALNLFAYTGAMSLATRHAGAETTHVDASKSVVQWAKENAALSGVSDIRFLVDDALKFLKREEKRHSLYACITLDPPAYGIGPGNARWQLEKLLPDLLHQASLVLAPDGLLILNTYSPKVGAELLDAQVKRYFPGRRYEIAELSLKSATGKRIDTGLVARIG